MRLARTVSLVAGLMLGFAVLPPVTAADADLPVRVTLNGRLVSVPTGMTLGELLESTNSLPVKGNLVSVRGRVLQARVVSGVVLLNGSPAKSEVELEDGAVVETRNGPDVREPTERTLAPAAGVGTPVRTIPVNYGANVYVVRGTISKEVVRESAVPGAKVKPAIALTFDDGPDPTWTLAILRVLRKYQVPATFFVLGRTTMRYPHIVRALRAVGMSVQNHSWNHENLGRMSPWATKVNLLSQIRAMRQQGLPLPTWFRPPYGSYNPATVRVATELGMRTAMWSVDTVDYRRPAPATIAQRAIRSARPGGIVLMHDGGGNRLNTLRALPTIIEQLAKRGYRFVALT